MKLSILALFTAVVAVAATPLAGESTIHELEARRCECHSIDLPCSCNPAPASPLHAVDVRMCLCVGDEDVCDCGPHSSRALVSRENLESRELNNDKRGCLCIIDGPEGEAIPCGCNPGFKAAKREVIERRGTQHCNCIIDNPDGTSMPCGCNSRREIETRDGPPLKEFKCLCLIDGEDGASVPCGCNSKRAFLGEIYV